MIVYSLSIVLMKFISLVSGGFDVTIAFLFPTALATMLVRLLADDKAAVLVTVMTAASAGVIFSRRLFIRYANGNYALYHFLEGLQVYSFYVVLKSAHIFYRQLRLSPL
ncbi:hypothetical protein OL548_27720 [Lysinibacillus sp. MHQ-1]|nr:hypothetical protein OL548_27720 [Lysinibacillus sp. MHQ-1]